MRVKWPNCPSLTCVYVLAKLVCNIPMYYKTGSPKAVVCPGQTNPIKPHIQSPVCLPNWLSKVCPDRQFTLNMFTKQLDLKRTPLMYRLHPRWVGVVCIYVGDVNVWVVIKSVNDCMDRGWQVGGVLAGILTNWRAITNRRLIYQLLEIVITNWRSIFPINKVINVLN